MDNLVSVSANSNTSLAQIRVFENSEGKQCVSARELYERLEITDRFSRWFESLLKYGFQKDVDFTSVKSSTLVNNGAARELQDYSITLDMAKQICMLQRSAKGLKYRAYFIKLEKAWNSPELVMARALQVANKTINNVKLQMAEIQQKFEIAEAKNEALVSDVLTWADRKVIQAIINKYGANCLDGNFSLAWGEYKKELLYKYSINLNSRKTMFLNCGGKVSTLKVLDLIEDSELPDAVRVAIAMAEKSNLDISDIVEKHMSKDGE